MSFFHFVISLDIIVVIQAMHVFMAQGQHNAICMTLAAMQLPCFGNLWQVNVRSNVRFSQSERTM